MKKLTTVFSAFVLLIILVGCNATLDPAGPYGGDQFLYDSDGAVIDARQTLDGFLSWEMQNRASLATSGNKAVTTAADKLRTTAPIYFGLVSQARAQYVAAKGPTTSNSLFQAVSVLQTQTLTAKAVTNSVKSTP